MHQVPQFINAWFLTGKEPEIRAWIETQTESVDRQLGQYVLGIAILMDGRMLDAEEYFESLANRDDSVYGAYSLAGRTHVALYSDRNNDAIELLAQLKSHAGFGSMHPYVRYHQLIVEGDIYQRFAEWPRAIESFLEAVRATSDAGLIGLQSTAEQFLAGAFLYTNRFELALEHSLEFARTQQQIPHAPKLSIAILQECTVRLELKQYELAEALLEAIDPESMLPFYRITYWACLGQVRASLLDDMGVLEECFAIAKQLAVEIDEPRLLANLAALRAQRYQHSGNAMATLAAAQEALEYVRTAEDIFQQIDATNLIYRSYKDLGRTNEALEFLELHQRLTHRKNEEELEQVISHVTTRVLLNSLTNVKPNTDSPEVREMSANYLRLTELVKYFVSEAQRLDEFKNELHSLVPLLPRSDPAASPIRRKINTLLQSDSIDVHKIEARLNDVHPQFRQTLIDRFPQLTQQELRLSVLARLGLKSYEMAQLLSLSERTIDGHRNNLRKKLGLKPSDSLRDFLSSL